MYAYECSSLYYNGIISNLCWVTDCLYKNEECCSMERFSWRHFVKSIAIKNKMNN